MKTLLLFLLLLPIPYVAYFHGNFLPFPLGYLFLYVLVPFLAALILGFHPKDLGLSRGKREGYKLALILLLLSIPLSLAGTLIPEMRSYYPIFPYETPIEFIAGELKMALFMFAHEFFYRGVLLFPLARRNKWGTILAQNVPYTLVHIGKPAVEIPYAFVAGIIFADLDLRAESIFPSFLLHWLGSMIFDVMCGVM
ncbi:CPBP family archaeomyxosortase MrtA [Pyrococcus yayanosii]|uniref:Membrane-associated metalloprotease n=1 Tax=Pyrococcus yayanosii (strain CH1 / JCM 16557) TaxID=529709 RepID=F8AIP2_PYRYC|nr:CPBP family archaeomyxosortase MrtA [Pyrococcus yayanosii]AEH24416.1 membrane-associated metalloprotease [Pyrococcus yayanosii CH1]